MKPEKLKKEIEKLWKVTKKDLEKARERTANFIKKGEECLKDVSEKGKDKLEKMRLTLKREKLYCKLGRLISGLPKQEWECKEVEGLIDEIKKIDSKLKRY